jgi:hypothetical protein
MSNESTVLITYNYPLAWWLWAVRSGDRMLEEVRFSAPVQIGPGARPASCKMGIVSFLGVESGRGVTLTPHPLLVSRSKYRVDLSIPLLSLRTFMTCKKRETYLCKSYILFFGPRLAFFPRHFQGQYDVRIFGPSSISVIVFLSALVLIYC